MSKITAFDRKNLQALRTDIDAALKAVGDKHGISLKLGRGTFSAETATFKLELGTVSDTGVVVTKEAQDFKTYALMFGLKPEHLGQSFKDFDGHSYKVVGLKVRSPKFPVLVERADGARFKFPEKRVANFLQ
jgi:hypothetical protein